MNPLPAVISLHEPATYRIQVAGKLPEAWAQQYGETECCVEILENGAILSSFNAPVSDQAALHGLLAQIRDLGLPLVALQLLVS